VNAGFQHFAHGDCHKSAPKVGSKIQSDIAARHFIRWHGRNTLAGLVCYCFR